MRGVASEIDLNRDRAFPEIVRIPLSEISFWPKLDGIEYPNGDSAMKVVSDILTGNRAQVYGSNTPVTVVKVPEDKLLLVKFITLTKCCSDKWMPLTDEDAVGKIKYVAVANANFVFAMKLFERGTCRSKKLYDMTWTMDMELKADDEEGACIINDGLQCAIYNESVFENDSAMRFLAKEKSKPQP